MPHSRLGVTCVLLPNFYNNFKFQKDGMMMSIFKDHARQNS